MSATPIEEEMLRPTFQGRPITDVGSGSRFRAWTCLKLPRTLARRWLRSGGGARHVVTLLRGFGRLTPDEGNEIVAVVNGFGMDGDDLAGSGTCGGWLGDKRVGWHRIFLVSGCETTTSQTQSQNPIRTFDYCLNVSGFEDLASLETLKDGHRRAIYEQDPLAELEARERFFEATFASHKESYQRDFEQRFGEAQEGVVGRFRELQAQVAEGWTDRGDWEIRFTGKHGFLVSDQCVPRPRAWGTGYGQFAAWYVLCDVQFVDGEGRGP